MTEEPLSIRNWTAAEIIALIRDQRHRPKVGDWLFIEELRTGTGYGRDCMQYIDAWAMHTWPSRQMMRIAYEVKISRGDFLVEIKNPRKRKPALLVSNEFYFVAPRGVILPAELPAECGLIEVHPDSLIHTRIAAPWRDTPPANWHFVASVCRRAQKELQP